MDKHVLAAAVRLNETKTLRRIEPLHCPGRHFNETSVTGAPGFFAITPCLGPAARSEAARMRAEMTVMRLLLATHAL
jgi:hypothetical protein